MTALQLAFNEVGVAACALRAACDERRRDLTGQADACERELRASCDELVRLAMESGAPPKVAAGAMP